MTQEFMKSRYNQLQWRGYVVVIMGVSWICGCRPSPDGYIVLKLPQGFSGPVLVIEDSNAPPAKKVGSKFEIQIDPTGVARIRSLASLMGWNEISAVFPDGKELPQGFSERTPREVIALWTTGTVNSNGIQIAQFWVGTSGQVDHQLLLKLGQQVKSLPAPTSASTRGS